MSEHPVDVAPPPESVLARAAHRLEVRADLDVLADPLADLAADRLGSGRARWWLGGGPLGHAAHPLLTDLPIGFWTSAAVLDLVGGRSARPAAQRLIGLGLACVPATVLTGASDWGASGDVRVRRVGLVHAATNGVATLAYLASWRARRRGRHLRGLGWGAVGGLVASVGGHLGGHLSYSLGSGVDGDAASGPPGAAR